MPCEDSSSSMVIKLDNNDRFESFEYAKITCGQDISANMSLNEYFRGKHLNEVAESNFNTIVYDLKIEKEDDQFIAYMQWDALRSAVALYLGLENKEIDTERCLITSIEETEMGTEIAEVILPPKELPKILPCSMNQQNPN